MLCYIIFLAVGKCFFQGVGEDGVIAGSEIDPGLAFLVDEGRTGPAAVGGDDASLRGQSQRCVHPMDHVLGVDDIVFRGAELDGAVGLDFDDHSGVDIVLRIKGPDQFEGSSIFPAI